MRRADGKGQIEKQDFFHDEFLCYLPDYLFEQAASDRMPYCSKCATRDCFGEPIGRDSLGH